MPDSIEGSKVRKDTDSLNATSRFRVLGNIIKQIRVFLSERAWCAQGSTSRWIRPWPTSNFSAWLRCCQQRLRPRYSHSKLSTNPACRLFIRAWVLDPMTARQRAPWRRHAVHMRARRRNAFQRSITPALTSDRAGPTSRRPIRSKGGLTDRLCY